MCSTTRWVGKSRFTNGDSAWPSCKPCWTQCANASFAARTQLLQRDDPHFVRCPSFCRSPALGAIGGGLRGLIAAGAPLPQRDAQPFVGAPHFVRCPAFCRSPALGAMGGGLRGLIAAGAPLPQRDAPHFVGAQHFVGPQRKQTPCPRSGQHLDLESTTRRNPAAHSLGVLKAVRPSTEKVPLNLIEVILAQGSLSKEPCPICGRTTFPASRPAITLKEKRHGIFFAIFFVQFAPLF